MEYQATWYWCEVTEIPEGTEPDWSKVPVHKVAEVKRRYMAKNAVTTRYKLWGPQIPTYQKREDMTIRVLGQVNVNSSDSS